MAVIRREQRAAAADPDGSKAARVASFVHIQVRKIREEDLRIGEGTGEGLSAWDGDLIALLHLNTRVSTSASAAVCSHLMPVMPASPLGNKSSMIGSSAA